MSHYASADSAAPAEYTTLPDDRFTPLGALRGYRIDGSTLVLDAGGPRLAITFLAEDIARVRLAPDGDFSRSGHGAEADETPFSYALDPSGEWPPCPIDVEERGPELRVVTSRMTLRVRKNPIRLRFEHPDGRLLVDDAAGVAMAREGERTQVRCWKQMPADARYFGLGDKTFPLDRRGHRYTFWNADTYAYGVEQDPIYKSIPFFLGLHTHNGEWTGYGLYFDNTYRSQMDFGSDDTERFWFGAEDGELRYYVFSGPDLKTPLRRYCDLTGHKPIPPRWSLGYHQSRWNYHDDGYALWIAHEFRRRGIPLECIHLDIGHMDGYRVFTWDDEAFPDPVDTNNQLRALGVRSVTIVDPGVKIDPDYFAYQSGTEQRLFCENPDGSFFTDTVWPGDVHWPDFTKPEARSWWARNHKRYLDSGVTGFWNDMNEPAILGGRDFPDEVQFAFSERGTGPTDHREAHNVYGQLMARATFEGLREIRPDERPFLLTRACFSGSQRYAAAWTGDNISSWAHLLLSLQICQSLSASGLAFCGPDIGGFAGSPSPELYARWMQAGVFYPFMRTHYSHEEIDKQEPWSFGEDVEAISRRYIGLRYELMPYLYTAFVDCCESAVPPMKALFLEHPEDPHTHRADDQFYFGPALLVAPVVEEGATERSVYFPDVDGGWYDFWTAETVQGGAVQAVQAPLETLPLFARAGQVVAMHPFMLHTEEFDPETLVLRTYPGNGDSATYFDDGISYAYQNGDHLRLDVAMSKADATLSISVNRTGHRVLCYRAFEWQIATSGLDASSIIQVDDREVPVLDDPQAFIEADEAAFLDGPMLRVRTRTDVTRLVIA